MKKILFVLFFLLLGCSNSSLTKINKSEIIFTENMNLKDFISKLEDYAKNSPYPNIDK